MCSLRIHNSQMSYDMRVLFSKVYSSQSWYWETRHIWLILLLVLVEQCLSRYHCHLAAPRSILSMDHSLCGVSVHVCPMSVWVSSCFSAFLPHPSMWTGYCKLALGVNVSVNVCVNGAL